MKKSYVLGALAGLGMLASGAVLSPLIAQAADPMGPPAAADGAPDGGMPFRHHWRGMGGPKFMMHHHQPGEHIDGRLAFLKAELKIQSNQEKAWSSFESAARKNASDMKGKVQGMKGDRDRGGLSVPERLDRMEGHLSARLGSLRAIKGETKALYAVLSAEQKKAFDDLFPGPMAPM